MDIRHELKPSQRGKLDLETIIDEEETEDTPIIDEVTEMKL